MNLRKIPFFLILVVTPVSAETYTHYSTYGTTHCKTTISTYSDTTSSSTTSCTTPLERRLQETRKKEWDAKLKENTKKLRGDCETYGVLKGQYIAEKNNWSTSPLDTDTPPWVTVQTQECQFDIMRGKLPDDYMQFIDPEGHQNQTTP